MLRGGLLVLAVAAVTGLGFDARAQEVQESQEPLSAIDWLSQPPIMTLDLGEGDSPPVTEGIRTPQIGVETLDRPGRDAVGLLPSVVTGFPADLWTRSSTSDLSTLITRQRVDHLPAAQTLLYTLLLAEANAPSDTAGEDRLLAARVDKLIELGAVEHAFALLERAGPQTPELFRQWFDVSLMLGQEDSACDALAKAPHLAPGYSARIFCTARRGDWTTAALTLNNASALGLLSPDEEKLLFRFLAPEEFEGEEFLPPPRDVSPLNFRLHEAIGEPLPTRGLKRGFAYSDLRGTAGWKAQLEAAERLASAGALPPNRLLGIYSERRPAASGMIWDRVAALQSFDSALAQGDPQLIAVTLPNALAAMQSAELVVPFANFYASALLEVPLTGTTAKLARDVVLLSSEYERAAMMEPNDFLTQLAMGAPPLRPNDPNERAISFAFNGAGVPQDLSTKLAQGQLGEVILRALLLLSDGAQGDTNALSGALATLRAVGLEDTARRAALQILLIDTRG